MVYIAGRQKRMFGRYLIVLGIVFGTVCVQRAYAEGEVLRKTAGGALAGAAVGKLSDGDTGKAAAWGAGIGAARGIASKRRAEQDSLAAQEKASQDARIRELELQQAYEKGRSDASK